MYVAEELLDSCFVYKKLQTLLKSGRIFCVPKMCESFNWATSSPTLGKVSLFFFLLLLPCGTWSSQSEAQLQPLM